MFAPILGNATTRYLYHFGETQNGAGRRSGSLAPRGVRDRARDARGDARARRRPGPLQVAFECSDGGGTVLMNRGQAEPAQPGGPLRWIVSGKTVLNNKGKPVKQYEPYFSQQRRAAAARATRTRRSASRRLMYYDAPGRLVRTEMPDGTFSRVEFSPWHVTTYDANDTAYDPDPDKSQRLVQTGGLIRRIRASPSSTAPTELAGAQSSQMHADTPALTILDSLGRDVIAHRAQPVRRWPAGVIARRALPDLHASSTPRASRSGSATRAATW